MDGQTEFPLQDGVCIVCSVLKSHWIPLCWYDGFYHAAYNADEVYWWEFCPCVCLSCLSHARIMTKWKQNMLS